MKSVKCTVMRFKRIALSMFLLFMFMIVSCEDDSVQLPKSFLQIETEIADTESLSEYDTETIETIEENFEIVFGAYSKYSENEFLRYFEYEKTEASELLMRISRQCYLSEFAENKDKLDSVLSSAKCGKYFSEACSLIVGGFDTGLNSELAFAVYRSITEESVLSDMFDVLRKKYPKNKDNQIAGTNFYSCDLSDDWAVVISEKNKQFGFVPQSALEENSVIYIGDKYIYADISRRFCLLYLYDLGDNPKGYINISPSVQQYFEWNGREINNDNDYAFSYHVLDIVNKSDDVLEISYDVIIMSAKEEKGDFNDEEYILEAQGSFIYDLNNYTCTKVD